MMVATGNAREVIDRAIQIWGGLGVDKRDKVEELQREIRGPRSYRGAAEVQQHADARAHLAPYQN